MIIDLLIPSIITGLCIAIAGGSLGCFIIWRRMAFFSDALAHSAVLGTALALLAELDIIWGLAGYGVLVAFVMATFDKKLHYSGDTLLAIISQISLAIGLLLLPLASQPINIENLLFGDILAVSWGGVILTAIVCLAILALLVIFWRQFIELSIDEELFAIEGNPAYRFKLLLFFMLAGLIAVAVQMVGVLLIASLMLIPAATARQFANTPLAMVLIAPLAGVVSVSAGLYLSYASNSAAGPCIVLIAAIIWGLSQIKTRKH